MTTEAQVNSDETAGFPLIGARVFIEPGQTEAETEGWFKSIHDNGMNICRICMSELYMRQPDRIRLSG